MDLDIPYWYEMTDHIAKQVKYHNNNGKNNDNRLENLRFLCPNCHSQTETYSGKNNKNKMH